MKFLTLIISLLILCCSVNAQDLNCTITENGCGKIKLGVSQKRIEKLLGKSDKEATVSYKSSKYLLIADYSSKGISIIYLARTKSVLNIYFYNNDSSENTFSVYPNAVTNKGINWKSTQENVIKAYGKPKDDFQGVENNINWRRMVYSKLDFRFENNILVRIGINAKEKEEITI